MDYTVTLTRDEVVALSDADWTWQDALQHMKEFGAFRLDDETEEEDVGSRFQESLRWKNTVDLYEEKGALMRSFYTLYCVWEKKN